MIYNVIRHGRWGNTCTSATPSYTASGTSCPIWTAACFSFTTDSSSVQPIQVPMPKSNWSHFKSEFTCKPDKGAEAHLLRTEDWMDTHAFSEGVKSSIFV